MLDWWLPAGQPHWHRWPSRVRRLTQRPNLLVVWVLDPTVCAKVVWGGVKGHFPAFVLTGFVEKQIGDTAIHLITADFPDSLQETASLRHRGQFRGQRFLRTTNWSGWLHPFELPARVLRIYDCFLRSELLVIKKLSFGMIWTWLWLLHF